MPWIVKLSFQEEKLLDIEKIDVFSIRRIRRAVGAIIVTPDNKFCLVHKSKICDSKEGKIDVGFWDFIKGGVRENETMLDAIKREIYEETGINKFVAMEELSDKICFDFSSNMKPSVGYDGQVTTMYIVQVKNQPSDLRCDDDEVDGYDFVNKGSVLDKLSHVETKEFWDSVIKRF
jgi:putative (di)nucleoside polyphosphate hydrolase